MQEALKTLEAAKDDASPEKLAVIDDDIAAFQEIYDMVVTEAAKWRKPLPAMQANVEQPKPNTMRPTTGQAAFRQN